MRFFTGVQNDTSIDYTDFNNAQLLGSSYRVKKMGFFTGVQNDTSIDYTDLNNAQFTVHNAQLLGSSYRVLKEEILR